MKVEILQDASCRLCGAENNEKYKHIALYRNEDLDYFVKCDNCSAMTPKMDSSFSAIAHWMADVYTIPTHTESQIYEGCVALMHGLVEEFKEWLDWQGIEVPEEERFCLNMHPTGIVNRLFLYHTSHSGGTSTRAKCHELGIDDCTRSIEFKTDD
jgi:hypothetical protein